MKRRHFLETSTAAAFATLAGQIRAATPAGKAPHIVLRSSWQTVNIGDIAHTPGVLHLLEKHLPEAQVTLWPSDIGNGVKEMLQKRFPKVIIRERSAENIKKIFAECDFLLHGSGPSLVAQNDVAKWHKETGKPYGIYGITFAVRGSTSTKDAAPERTQKTISVFNEAKFTFFRDTVSLALAKELGCTCPIMEFGPDGAFACDVRNDEAAEKFLKANGL
ncbi:MAG: polysaccharide pyruvyl transferase family protein, partial [Verrucomicrobiales bacterium]